MNPEAKNKPRDICPVKKGYGMSVVSLNLISGASLYSVTDKLLKTMSPTLDECRAKQQAWQSKFHSIKDLIQAQSVPFFVKRVSTEATIDLDERPELLGNDPAQLCVTRWCSTPGGDGGNCVDVLHEDAMRATNCTDIRSACALLELAANAGALSMVVCANQYRPGKEHLKSMYYGFPIIDTKVLLQSIVVPVDSDSLTVDETENYFVFEAGFKVAFPKVREGVVDSEAASSDQCDDEDEEKAAANGDDDDEEEMLCPHLYISKDPFTHVKGGHVLPTQDCMMVGANVQLQKAYFARFVHPLHPQRCVLWGGYVNMSKPQITMPGEKMCTCNADSDAGTVITIVDFITLSKSKVHHPR